MANWLSRASSLFQKHTPQPEPFEVVCDCGGRVAGERTTAYQKPNCQSCGRPVFVLPLNVYPVPKSKTKPRPKKSDSENDDVSTKAAPKPVDDRNTSSRSLPTKSTDPRRTKGGSPAKQTGDEPEFLPMPPSRPFFTPLRKMIAAIVVLGLFTVGGVWYQNRLVTAKATVSRAAEAGLAALRERDFATAARELGKARSAVDIIGRTDEAAAEIRRCSREATAITSLASGSLADILQLALASGNPDRKDSLQLPSADRRAWVIFDAGVLPSETVKNRYVINSPIQFDDASVIIEIDTAIFKKLPESEDASEATRTIFAAQLEKIAYSRKDSSKVILKLDGNSAFLWSNFNTYTAIGYLPFDEESERQTRAVLERQIEMQL